MRWGSAAAATFLVLLAACQSEPLPEPGFHAASMTRLQGAPSADRDPARVRVLVADLGFGMGGPSPVERLEGFAHRAAPFAPDVAVLFDAPAGGPAFVLTTPGGPLGIGASDEVVDPAELLAVEFDRYHRLHAVGRPERAGQNGRVAGGTLVLSEAAIDCTACDAVDDFRFSLQLGPNLSVPVRVGGGSDGSQDPPEVSTPAALHVRRAPCTGQVVSDDGGLCVDVGDGWTVLRADGGATMDGTTVGAALRLELQPPRAALAPAEGSQ